jgi:ribosomal protein S20
MNKHNFKVGQVYKGKECFSYLNGGRPFTVMAVDPDHGLKRTSSDGEFQDSWVSFESAANMWELVQDVPEEPKADDECLSLRGVHDGEVTQEVAEERLAEIMRLDRVVDDLKKQLHDAKMAEDLALTGREQAEEALGRLNTEFDRLHGTLIAEENEVSRLKNELSASEKEEARAQESANKFYHETKDLKTRIKELEDAVKFERGRLTSALEVADNAASGIGAMSRTFHIMSDLAQRIESKLEK